MATATTVVIPEDELEDTVYDRVEIEPTYIFMRHQITKIPLKVYIINFTTESGSLTRTLYCNEHPTDEWCDDLYYVVRKGWDSRLLMTEKQVLVPVVPTTKVWQDVLFIDDEDARQVVTTFAEGSEAAKLFGTTAPIVCYTVEGEGLWTIRTALSQALDAATQNSAVTLKCKNNLRHNFNYIQAWNRSMLEKNTWYGQQWSVFSSGYCMMCNDSRNRMAQAVPES